jgi:hypothetical protein
MGRLIGGARQWRRGARLRIMPTENHILPRFRALPGEGETPTSCLLRIDWTVSITMLLELFGLEEEERDRIPQTKGLGPLIKAGAWLQVRWRSSRLPAPPWPRSWHDPFALL